jgi:2'-5' RNA ligase
LATERLKSPRARLFVALDLPDEISGSLVSWQERAMRDPALRPLARQALHVTLCFLGYRPERAIPEIAAEIVAVTAGAVPMELQPEPQPLPPSRPRLFAVEARSEAAVAVQADVAARLERAGHYRPEKRPFWPHITAARVRPEKGHGRRPRRVAEGPGPLPERLLAPFDCVRIALYRSNLRPTGAEYVRLGGLDLPPTVVGKR